MLLLYFSMLLQSRHIGDKAKSFLRSTGLIGFDFYGICDSFVANTEELCVFYENFLIVNFRRRSQASPYRRCVLLWLLLIPFFSKLLVVQAAHRISATLLTSSGG